MVHAVIFDMDGLLINSEPFWQQAEKEIFGSVDLQLTTAMCESMMGLRIDEVVEHWFNYQPWEGPNKDEIRERIVDRVIELIDEKGELMQGVEYAIDFFASRDLKMSIASSSNMRIITFVIEKFNLAQHFSIIHSAEFEKYGKPHPDIFIHTAHQLEVSPLECLVFEDSFNGVIAAKAARMKVIAIPEPLSYPQTRFDIADIKLKNLSEFNTLHWETLNS